MTVESFFADPAPETDGVRRDGQGRPLLVPRGMPREDRYRTAYTRASSLSGFISESEHFHKWEMRYLAKGMGQRPDLAALAAVEPYNTGLTHPVFGREKGQSGRNLDSIIERALDAVGIHEKADYGTAVHAFTEPGAPAVPGYEGGFSGMPGDVESFWGTVRSQAIEIVDTERFTANDVTMSAGTFDHGMRFPGHPLLTGYVITDKKTGRTEPWEWAVQIGSYANSDCYDPATDERTSFPEDINLKYAAVFQIKDGATRIHILDIEAGWEAAQHAAWVRDYHDRGDLLAVYKPARFEDRLAASNTRDALARLWHSTKDPAERAVVETKASTIS